MFDIGFSELILLSVIALVVLGPDRLPGTLRTAGLWIGRLRRSFNSIKADIEREVGADEIRRQLRNEAIMEKIKNTRSQVTQTIESVKKDAESVTQDLDVSKELKELASEAQKYAEPPPADDDQEAPAGSKPAAVTAEPAPQPMPSASVPPAPEPVPTPAVTPAPEPAHAERKESGQK